MTDDTISRQAAIKAICEDGTMLERQGKYTMTMAERKQKDADILDSLPSAQPGWTTDVNNILAYLDGTVHPLVSPENWNVYSELYDMVSGLLKPWEGKQDGEG